MPHEDQQDETSRLAAAGRCSQILSINPPSPEVSRTEQLRAIAKATGKSPIDTMRDFARLASGRGKLAFQDYVNLRLFDNAFYEAPTAVWSQVESLTLN